MASNLVIIRGLDRGSHPAGSAGLTIDPGGAQEAAPAAVRGFRVKAPIGRHYNQEIVNGALFASETYTTGVPSNAQVTYTANYAGSYGNSIQVAHVTGGGLNIALTWQSASANPLITVTLPSGTPTASGIVEMVNADEQASQFVTASYAGTGGGGVALFTAANLTGGSNGGNADAEPPYGSVGEPIWLRITNKTGFVVDTTDTVTARILKRNKWRYEVVGFP